MLRSTLTAACAFLAGCGPSEDPPQVPPGDIQGAPFNPTVPETPTPAAEPRLGDTVLAELGAGLPVAELVPALLKRWLPGHGDIRTRLEKGHSARWFAAIDAAIPADQRPRLVEYVHRTFASEAKMLEKFYEIGRSSYDKRAQADAAQEMAFAREDFQRAATSATKRLLRDLSTDAATAVRALAPGEQRGWLSRDEVSAERGK